MTDEMTPKWGVEILLSIERLTATIAANDQRHTAHSEWAVRNLHDHEKRIRTIEQFMWKVLGGSALLGAVSGFLATLLSKTIFGG